MFRPISQNTYVQSIYHQVQNVQQVISRNLNQNPPQMYYPNGAYIMPNPNLSNPQIYPNNYRTVPPPVPQAPPQNYTQTMKQLKLDEAINTSVYQPSKRDIILATLLDNFSDKKNDKVYLQAQSHDKIFIIHKIITAKLSNKSYNIPVIIHLPAQYPNLPPEIYMHKKPKVGINKFYFETNKLIDPTTFRIYFDHLCPFNPSRNNIDQIIEALKIQFSKIFPIYADKTDKSNQMPKFGPENPDFRTMNEVIVESETLTDKQVYELVKKQTKEAILNKYQKFKTQYRVAENYKELKTINDITKLKAGNALNGCEHPMVESLNKLKDIKYRLNGIEDRLNQEIKNTSNINKTPLEKCEDLIKIKDEEDLKLLVMKKTIEDLLIYLKKGYERKIVSFDDMVNQTRALSRELFSIDYLRSQRKLN